MGTCYAFPAGSATENKDWMLQRSIVYLVGKPNGCKINTVHYLPTFYYW